MFCIVFNPNNMFRVLKHFPIAILFVSILCLPSLYAQHQVGKNAIYEIKGKVVDASNALPIEHATVSLISAGKVLQTVTTDLGGAFKFGKQQTGSPSILVTYVGYESHLSKSITTSNVLEIRLVSQLKSLEEIVVKGKRKPIRYKSDKLIYDAGSDISNKAGSAVDLLRKVPLLTVGSNGELRMRGNTNIKVLLNGIPSGIMAKNLKDALKMIPASSIKSVEVITSPSAKYEAEGVAGIINIITKKSVRGTHGSLDFSLGNLDQSGSGSWSTTTEKFDFNFNATMNAERERNRSILQRTSLSKGVSVGELLQHNDETEKDRGASASLGFVYRPDSSQKIGADLSYWYGSWPARSSLYNLYQDGETYAEYNQFSQQRNSVKYYELSLNYLKRFRRKAQELQILGLAARSNDRSEYITSQKEMSEASSFNEKGPNKGDSWDFDFQVDYTHPIDATGKNVIETGMKLKRSNSGSLYIVFNNEHAPGSEELVEIPSRSDKMDYYSTILAGYMSLKIETDDQWTIRPGIRFETTVLGADFRSSTPSFKSKFGNWVPTMLVAKKLNDHHELKFAYTERIRRPWIWDLNPYVNASDPRNLLSGNPLLRPERIRVVELGHNYNAASGFNLNSSVYYSTNNNSIEQLTVVDSLGISRTTPSNIATNKRLGTQVNLSMELQPNWMLNGGLELYYVWFRSAALQVRNSNGFYAANLSSSYGLSKGYSLQISGDYNNGYVTLQGRNTAEWSYRFAAQKELWNDRASIVLTVSNPFQRVMTQRSMVVAPSFRSTTSNNYYNRSVSLSFSWKFGASRQKEGKEEKNPLEMEHIPHRRK